MRFRSAIALIVSVACTSGTTDVPPSDNPDTQTADTASGGDEGAADATDVPDAAAPGDLAPSDAPPTGDTPEPTDAEDGPDTAGACVEGTAQCVSYQEVKRCTGGAWVTSDCDDGQVCLGGEAGDCGPPVCEPNSTQCSDAQRQICDSIGSGWLTVPCPAGFGCKEGACSRVLANVILIVDTSGSMSFPANPKGKCQSLPCGDFTFPVCEDPAAPSMRIGHTKAALASLFDSPLASNVRLALQRFPQQGSGYQSCASGYYADLGTMTGDTGGHVSNFDKFAKALGEITPVEFDAVTGASNLTSLKQWVDFDEKLLPSAVPCQNDFQCDSHICVSTVCATHENPELRAVGGTPLGQSLFYAGEYLRHFMLIEGKECTDDADCATSPDHTCRFAEPGDAKGECHDPFAKCRPSAIVLFTDGEETQHPDTSDFFNPWVQAKRLHYGLACTADIQCSAGATCVDKECTPAVETAPPDRCLKTFEPCLSNTDCPAYFCGANLPPCPGQCVSSGFNPNDTEADYLQGYQGDPPLPIRNITVHVADASGGFIDNAFIADWGGGEHVAVDFENAESILQALSTLVDIKQGAVCD